MHRCIFCALAAAGTLLGAHGPAFAQSTAPYAAPPLVEPEATPRSASPHGARYIPGVGFRYVAPGGASVYGYRAYGPRVYGYRRAAGGERCRWFWLWDDCRHRR